jgi:hypothetical protein
VILRILFIGEGSSDSGITTHTPHVPVIPIRMTEAWLLLDEAEIRRVAGSPNGKVSLGLPKAKDVESIPDPKAQLAQTLAIR